MSDPILLEWRRRGPMGPVGCSANVRDAAEAVRLAVGVASGSVNGEYRVVRRDGASVYASAAGLSAWAAEGDDMPPALPASLWRRETERAAALEQLMGALRSVLEAAARRGLLPQKSVHVVLRMVAFAVADPPAFGDNLHGSLSR